MRRWLALALGGFDAVNGLVMLFAPAWWYGATPGVAHHGPLNVHFVQDVGAAFLAAGIGLLMRAARPAWWPAAAVGSAFLGAHALLHLVGLHADTAATDLALVVLPAALAAAVSIPAPGPSRAAAALARAGLGAFERRYGYDTGYMRWMLERAPGAFYRFLAIGLPGNHRAAAPIEAVFAAKLVGAVSEDCGPCTQLVANMAAEAGVPADQVRAVLRRDVGAMSQATALGFRFADAVVGRRGLEVEDAAREAVRAAWGDEAVVDVVLAWTIGRVFPATKAGLGFARECRLVEVDGATIAVVHADPEATAAFA